MNMKKKEIFLWSAFAVFVCANFILFSISMAGKVKTQKEMQNETAKSALSFQDESFEIGKHLMDVNNHMLEQLKIMNKELDTLKPSYELLVYQRDRHKELIEELDRQIILKDRSIKIANEMYALLLQSAKVQDEITVLQKKLYTKQKVSLKLSRDGIKKAEDMLVMAKETQKIGEEGLAMAEKINEKIKGMFSFGGM